LRIVAQMIVRNEENRYLDPVIPKILDVVDKLIIIDDASTDNTVAICRGFKKTVVRESKERRWLTDESSLRGELWEYVREQKPDWVLSLDADEVLDANSFNWDKVFKSERDWLAVHFYEMWNDRQYRTDGFWSTTITPIFRFQDCPFGWKHKFHCPRFPQSMSKNGGFLEGIRVQHLAYLKDEDKKNKSEFYCRRNLGGSLKHAKTILDEPELRDYDAELPSVVVASPIRNRSSLLPQFLDSIYKLNYPKDKLSYHFIVNDSMDEIETVKIIEEWEEKNKLNIVTEIMDFGTDAKEHHWDDKKLDAMRFMRNRFLNDLENNDYLFEVDCGILFPDPDILLHLVNLRKDVVSPVFWARWDSRQTILLPNVWVRDGYELGGLFLEEIKKPGVYPVGGLGAATLISKKVWEYNINYNRVTNLPRDMRGEDRDFCVRCNVHGIELWADSFYPVTHLDSVPSKVNIFE